VIRTASWAARPGGPRPHFTGRAAILAIVLCAIALSLAYPVREYIEQRRQIDQLQAQQTEIAAHLKNLEHERNRLNSPSFIEHQARDRLHMCLPTQMCYVVIAPATRNGKAARAPANSVPWYARLWSSVQQANKPQPARARHG
jgi:cell division protein FtsB